MSTEPDSSEPESGEFPPTPHSAVCQHGSQAHLLGGKAGWGSVHLTGQDEETKRCLAWELRDTQGRWMVPSHCGPVPERDLS